MTPEQIEIHRKRFEEVCGWTSNHVLRKDSNGCYECYETGILFKGYLLCAEDAAAIELPDAVLFYTAEIVYLDELVEKLESQGFTVKPR